MTDKRKIINGILATVGLVAVLAGVILGIHLYRRHRRPLVVVGAVIKLDADTRKQSPIANVLVSSLDNSAIRSTESNFSGGFGLVLRPTARIGQTIRLAFRHPDFEPLDLTETLSCRLLVVKM